MAELQGGRRPDVLPDGDVRGGRVGGSGVGGTPALNPADGWAVPTSRGEARVALDLPDASPSALVVLGHGAGGNVDAPDLVAVRDACLRAGVAVARVTQPYRVAGRRPPAPAGHLDEAFVAAVADLRPRIPAAPLVVGGRSSGARVACRTAASVGAAGVVALAFPEHPPGKPDRSRSAELATGLPTLVVNGDRDPFGRPAAAPGRTIEVLPGADHGLVRVADEVAALVVAWLRRHGWAH